MNTRSAYEIQFDRNHEVEKGEVFLVHNGEPVFSVSHSEIDMAYLVRFSSQGLFYSPSKPDEQDNPQPIRKRLKSAPASSPSVFSLQVEKGLLASRFDSDAEEYLCVIHKDDLPYRFEAKDGRLRHGKEVTHRLNVCSSYHISSALHEQLTLPPHLSILGFATGVHGLFVEAFSEHSVDEYELIKYCRTPVIEVGGLVYNAVDDLWWIASPLTIKPVYVLKERTSSKLVSSPKTESEKHSLNLLSSEMMGSSSILSLGAKPVVQFIVEGGGMFALAHRGNSLQLAITETYYPLSVMLWRWMEHSIVLPGTHHSTHHLFARVVEGESLRQQVIFVLDTLGLVMHIIRTPDLTTQRGALEILFTIPYGAGEVPTMLRCTGSLAPPLVLLPCYPSNNQITLYDVRTLIEYRNDGSFSPTDVALAILTVDAKDPLLFKRMQSKEEDLTEEEQYQVWSIKRIPFILSSSVVLDMEYCEMAMHAETKAAASLHFSMDFRHPATRLLLPYPSFSSDSSRMLHLIVEVVRLSLGEEVAWDLIYATLKEGWIRMEEEAHKRKYQEIRVEVVMSALFYEALILCVRLALYGPLSGEEVRVVASTKSSFSSDVLCALSDPFGLSAETVKKCVEVQPRGNYDQEHRWNRMISSLSKVAQRFGAESCGLLLLGMHVLFESATIYESLWHELEVLGELNLIMSQLLQWGAYTSFYMAGVAENMNFSTIRPLKRLSMLVLSSLSSPREELPSPREACCSGIQSGIFWVVGQLPTLAGKTTSPYSLDTPLEFLHVLLRLVETRSARDPQEPLFWLVMRGLSDKNPIITASHIFSLYSSFQAEDPYRTTRENENNEFIPWWQQLIQRLVTLSRSNTWSLLQNHQLSLGVSFSILQALEISRNEICEDTTEDELSILGRVDQLSIRGAADPMLSNCGIPQMGMGEAGNTLVRSAEQRAVCRSDTTKRIPEEDDGVFMPSDFPQMFRDTRLERVQLILKSSCFITVSDSDLRNTGKELIMRLGFRACASTLGRGLFALHTQEYKSCGSIPIPELVLHGKTDSGVFVANQWAKANARALHEWPMFHNSCAAGLRFLPPISNPSGSAKSPAKLASREILLYQWGISDCCYRPGLYLAAGLLGYFESLQVTDWYKLLVLQESDQEYRDLTTIAMLLGLGASYRGTGNSTVFDCLTVHILSLTPAEEEAHISMNVQTAAFVALGLLYQGKYDNEFLQELLLVELTMLPSDDNCRGRQGYALGAGIGLGLMLLGSGRYHKCLQLSEILLKVMDGYQRQSTENPPLKSFADMDDEVVTSFPSKYIVGERVEKTECCLESDGNFYNPLVMGPAAVMALGLMYLKTGDTLLAKRLAPPNNIERLRGLSPIMALLRTMMASLVMWDVMEPTQFWAYYTIPPVLRSLFLEDCTVKCRQLRQYLVLTWGYCLAGAVLALGLRGAGTLDVCAKATIVGELRGFLQNQIGTSGVKMSSVQKSCKVFDTCISACCIAASLVMAGSGDPELLELYQKLYKFPQSYSMYMSLSMSLGFLFLGGGRFSLSNSTSSIAALLISIYPVWPSSISDNLQHLQALRHFYTLAVVPRVVEVVDVKSQQPVAASVRIMLRHPSKTWGPASQGKGNNNVLTSGGGLNEEISAKERFSFFNEKNRDIFLPNITKYSLKQVRESFSPVLYPSHEVIESIVISSVSHHVVSLSREKGQISPDGMRVQLLEKRASEADYFATAVHHFTYRTAFQFLSASEPWAREIQQKGFQNMYANCVVDWVKELCRPVSTNPLRGRILLLNIRLIQACQRALKVHPIEPHKLLLTFDFDKAVEEVLNNRYRIIFFPFEKCFNSDKVSNVLHPFQLLLIEKRSEEYVLIYIAEQLGNVLNGTLRERTGPHVFFEALLTTIFSAQEIKLLRELKSLRDQDMKRLRCWLRESLNFYGLNASRLNALGKALTAVEVAEWGLKPSQRVLGLLRLHRSLSLSFLILEKIAACCF